MLTSYASISKYYRTKCYSAFHPQHNSWTPDLWRKVMSLAICVIVVLVNLQMGPPVNLALITNSTKVPSSSIDGSSFQVVVDEQQQSLSHSRGIPLSSLLIQLDQMMESRAGWCSSSSTRKWWWGAVFPHDLTISSFLRRHQTNILHTYTKNLHHSFILYRFHSLKEPYCIILWHVILGVSARLIQSWFGSICWIYWNFIFCTGSHALYLGECNVAPAFQQTTSANNIVGFWSKKEFLYYISRLSLIYRSRSCNSTSYTTYTLVLEIFCNEIQTDDWWP